ncbi:MAG: ATPase [Bacteroidetes bacterium]|nr:MAG: ATPase [Bacteroidota bacterium]
MNKKWLIAIFVVLISGMLVFGIRNAPNIPSAKAVRGVIDLRNEKNFDDAISLNGEWSFHWQEFLLSEDSNNSNKVYRDFPSLWKNISLNGQRLPSTGYATYFVKILLPKSRPTLALEMPDVYSSYLLYVNGKLVSRNGTPGKTPKTATPFWCTQVVHMSNAADTLRICLQMSNFWHTKGGTYKNIFIGKEEQLMLKKDRTAASNLVLTGCLFMGGLFFLGLYAFGKHDKAILYFSLFCIFYSYRMIGTDQYVLHSILPKLPWLLTIKMEYLSLTVGVAFFALYIRYLYPKEANNLFILLMTALCFLYAFIILVTMPRFFTTFLTVFLGIMFLYIAYAFYIFIRAAWNNRAGSEYAFLSTGVMLMLFLIINLHYFGIIAEMKGLVFAGYIAFFFLQSLILSFRFSHTLRQAAILAQQGLKTKSEFLSTMSHEIRTPLNAVIGTAHMLLRNQPREDQKESMKVLLFSANNLLSIVNDILDYNKIEAGKISFENIPIDLQEIMSNIISSQKNFAEEKRIDLILSFDQNIKYKVVGDPTRLAQVMTNLVHNAIKFTTKGFVKVFVDAEKTEEQSIFVKFKVEDTGIGISRDKQQLIFERFTQADSSTSRSYGGTGLGLAICKKILDLQGIQLHLESEVGKGSEFSFTQKFGLTSEFATGRSEIGEVSQPGEKSLDGISILLVEDNPFNVMVAQTILEDHGALIDIASNGEEAIEMLDSSKHKLVLMDIHMPLMDGYKATQKIRKNGATLPIIALTASTPQEVEQEAYTAGFTDIIVKPFNPDDLCRVILQHTQFVA